MSSSPDHSPRRALLVGASGQLGRALRRRLAASGSLVTAGRRGQDVALDLACERSIKRAVRIVQPTHVINAAAYTDVDGAESDLRQCLAVNQDGVGYLAEACERFGSGLIHVSTDYVFDGTSERPYAEADRAAPVNVYGWSKLWGEARALATDARCLILRTSWLYSRNGPSFLTTMRRLLAERPRLEVVADQLGCPTWTHDLAMCITDLLPRWGVGRRDSFRGVIHASGNSATTWHAWATDIARATGSNCRVEPTTTDDWAAPAPRPAYSVLRCATLAERFGLRLRGWPEVRQQVLEEAGRVSHSRGRQPDAPGRTGETSAVVSSW